MPVVGADHQIVDRRILRVLVTLCACVVAACGSSTVSQVSSPSGTRCGSSIAGLPDSVAASGGQFAATVTAARECTWTADSDASWLKISPTTGQGETAVSVVVTENPTGISRTASVTVNSTKMSVRQDAAMCRFAWKATSVEVPASGGTVTIGVSATPGCAWQASTSASWLRGTHTSGTGDGSAEFEAVANEGTERTATLRVGDASITVTQAAADGSGPTPPAPPPPAPAPTPPLIATYTGTASGAHTFDVSGALSLAPGTYRITFNRSATIFVRGVAGGGGGGGGKRRDDGGTSTAGGGGGGGGAANLSGQSISIVSGTTYEAVVGTGGSGGAGATEASGNTAGNGNTGGQTYFRIQSGTIFLQLNGGSAGSGGAIISGSGGAGGAITIGSGAPGGAGGNGGGDFGRVSPQTGGGTSGVNTGGGGGGGHSNEQSSTAGGAPGAQGGASGGAGGSGASGGNAGNGTTDSGAGGEGARDSNGDDSAGGGGGGGKGITVTGGPSNRGGGGGGGGAINTGNSADRGGNGGAGGNGGLSIGIR